MTAAQIREAAKKSYLRLGGVGNQDARLVRAMAAKIEQMHHWISEQSRCGTCCCEALGEKCPHCLTKSKS